MAVSGEDEGGAEERPYTSSLGRLACPPPSQEPSSRTLSRPVLRELSILSAHTRSTHSSSQKASRASNRTNTCFVLSVKTPDSL